MTFEKVILEIFKYSRGTFYSWKKEQRPIINLVEKYFNKEELEEFLSTGVIKRQERLKELEEIELKYKKILSVIKDLER